VQELKFVSEILHSVARDNEGLVKLGFKLNNLTGHANHFKMESTLGNYGTQKYDACISKHIPGSISSWFVFLHWQQKLHIVLFICFVIVSVLLDIYLKKNHIGAL